MADSIDFQLDVKAREEDLKVIDSGLSQHTFQIMGENRMPCFVFARSAGNLVGGLKAFDLGEDFYVSHIWVDQAYRSQNVGAELMRMAETEAQIRGCKKISVDTMSFQGPWFYEKLKYKESGRVVDFIDSYDRIFFRKDI